MITVHTLNEESFTPVNSRRLVLIVDDELVNREMLRLFLNEDFDTLTAESGEEALSVIHEKSHRLSLILLDLLMPGLHGLDVLRILKEDPDLKRIPVIVLTADQKAEVESLKAGAVDFISKPYPDREVVLARVRRTIEMTEDRDTIRSTERDSLTGLYNREYFFRYTRLLDQRNPDADMDAIRVDICQFRVLNERFGRAYGDAVLRQIGERLLSALRPSGGIVCRPEADVFLAWCPHREDYAALQKMISEDPAGEANNKLRLRMGIYPHADRTIEPERRFDRAKMASDAARRSYISSLAFYNEAMHESEIYAARLMDDFRTALQEKQFKVYFQPKYDIRSDTPVLASAEALVRWIHPELGFISPGTFIPLFEKNGMIQQLDLYVWRETAAQIREWKQRFGLSVPVSVNVSRVDMYDPNLVDVFAGLLKEFSLEPREFLLEITESAYTQDSDQIIRKVHMLRDLGFRIEMDDFGTGYSSLNMISTLPIDALKLDMAFIRNAFAEGGNMRLIGIIIDIADYLSVPVIAEGVETESQMTALKAMGCDLVQGYYFSKPVPPSEFERFIQEKLSRPQPVRELEPHE